jgi:aspartyl-tRNA synthetase
MGFAACRGLFFRSENLMKSWRTHHCGQLNSSHIGQTVTLAGWVHVARNLGGINFIDLRDHHGITQVIVHPDRPFAASAASLRPETVIQVEGKVIKREGAVNPKLPTGEIELVVERFHVESEAEVLPFPVSHDFGPNVGEDIRLKHRYLDLRREKLHASIVFRSKVVSFLRRKFESLGFIEFQTPILTSSSPEGARDYIVPSRVHPGKFYALPQAPQQFKQLLMTSGFDRYFQIAPCFRDEDARADRSPGEFYQLDVEMCFATQDDVFAVIERAMIDTFTEFSQRKIAQIPFPRIPYRETMAKYGSDKPDLRFGLEMHDAREIFKDSAFGLFKTMTAAPKGVISVIRLPGGAAKSRKFYSDLEGVGKDAGLGGVPWLALQNNEWRGSVAKVITEGERAKLAEALGVKDGDGVVFVVGDKGEKTLKGGGALRNWAANEMQLINRDIWAFCWIVDFPMFEYNEEDAKVDFSHNPFSMPQGGMEALQTKDPLDILAYQYDIVCNGVELSSGAVRNHRRDIMEKAFATAGYGKEVLEEKFPALYNAFRFGAPPHAGIAPGVDRMVMLLLDESNLREVIAFPLNQKAQCLLMGAPSSVSEKQLRETHIRIEMPKETL